MVHAILAATDSSASENPCSPWVPSGFAPFAWILSLPRPLTRRRFPGSFSAVSFLRRIVALILLSLWLPATLHCQLEAAGFATLFTCTEDHHDSTHSDHAQPNRDSCDILEAATFKPAANPTIAPHRLPAWDAPIFVRATPTLGQLPALMGVVDFVAPPPEISPTWHFTTRAALPARAPSFA